MIGSSTFTGIFGSVPAGNTDYTPRLARFAAAAGLAVVANKPGQKIPICTLTGRQARTADKQVQEAARDAGHPRWQQQRHNCGLAHALTDPPTAERTIKRLCSEVGPINLGVELGASRMVVVDLDTAAEQAAFGGEWEQSCPDPYPGYTVLSPGVLGADQNWKHKDGGHIWFTLPPDLELPNTIGTLTGDGGWVCSWARHQVLVPPSVRPEGPYTMVGSVHPLPSWLIDRIMLAVESWDHRKAAQLARRQSSNRTSSAIDDWSATTPWAEILEPDGWVDTGLHDNCSCPVWTAPGTHASPKSATAHELGCARYDTEFGHGPLHLWTDNPPEFLHGRSSTLTKHQYSTARDGKAATYTAVASNTVMDLYHEPAMAEEQPDIPTWDSMLLGTDELDSIPQPEPLIHGVLDQDTITRIVGKSSHGKSFAALDMALCVATGTAWHGHAVKQGPVIYVVAEGVRGFQKRVRAWLRSHGLTRIPKHMFGMYAGALQTKSEQWHDLERISSDTALVVLDTQARITVGVNENDAKEMGEFVHKVETLRIASKGACVCIIHHLGHSGDNGRGSTAVTGAVNTEIRVTKDKDGVITLFNDKQKDEAEFEPIKLHLEPDGDSAVLTDLGDPFNAEVGIGPHSPHEVRAAKILHDNFGSIGATEAKLWSLVNDRDVWVTGKPMGRSTFYAAFATLRENNDVVRTHHEDKPTSEWVVSSAAVRRWNL